MAYQFSQSAATVGSPGKAEQDGKIFTACTQEHEVHQWHASSLSPKPSLTTATSSTGICRTTELHSFPPFHENHDIWRRKTARFLRRIARLVRGSTALVWRLIPEPVPSPTYCPCPTNALLPFVHSDCYRFWESSCDNTEEFAYINNRAIVNHTLCSYHYFEAVDSQITTP